MTIVSVIVCVSILLFLLAAINFPNPSPINLGWLGLFFYALATLLT